MYFATQISIHRKTLKAMVFANGKNECWKTFSPLFFCFGRLYVILSKASREKQGCQIFLGTTYQNGKNIPNDHKIYQMAINYIFTMAVK
jgi:hypothetical protein